MLMDEIRIGILLKNIMNSIFFYSFKINFPIPRICFLSQKSTFPHYFRIQGRYCEPVGHTTSDTIMSNNVFSYWTPLWKRRRTIPIYSCLILSVIREHKHIYQERFRKTVFWSEEGSQEEIPQMAPTASWWWLSGNAATLMC